MSDEKKEEKKPEKKELAAPSTIRRKRKKGAAHAVKIPQGGYWLFDGAVSGALTGGGAFVLYFFCVRDLRGWV